MDESSFKNRAKRLKEVNEIVKDLVPEIRQGAFDLLKAYVGPAVPASSHRENPSKEDDPPAAGLDAGDFFLKFDHEKPADNAKLIAAYHYSKFGTAPFSVDEIKDLAAEVGITIPERPDMTFLDSRRNGKNLFKRAGRGKFRPTVHGEKYLRESYDVAKGTQRKSENPET